MCVSYKLTEPAAKVWLDQDADMNNLIGKYSWGIKVVCTVIFFYNNTNYFSFDTILSQFGKES